MRPWSTASPSSTWGRRRWSSAASIGPARTAQPAEPAPRARGRVVPHRPAGGGRRGAGAGRRRLAGARGRALLPGDRARPDGPGPPAALRHQGPPDPRHRGRAVRRGPPRRDGRRAACRATRPCWPRWRPAARASSATSSAPSRPSRTRSSAPRSPASSWSRAGRAPARRWWRCTGPPTSSTPTGSRWRTRASSWSAPTGCSCATSSRCCPRSARPASSWSSWPTWCPTCELGAADSRQAARVKGDARMARVLAKAVHDRERPLREDLVVPLRRDHAAPHRRRQRPHREGRPAPLPPPQRRPALRGDRGVHGAGRQQPHPRPRRTRCGTAPATSTRCARRSSACGRCSPRPSCSTTCSAPGPCCAWRRRSGWPTTNGWRCTGPRHTNGQPAVVVGAPTSPCSTRPASCSVPGPAAAPTGAEAEIRTYGHIVVDEVQDLTPMQLRMVARRSLNGSMTVVGDIAQATGPFAPDDWSEVLAHLPDRRPARVVELTIGYRIPGQIMAMANRILRLAAPQIVPPDAVREGDALPEVRRVAADELGAGVIAARACAPGRARRRRHRGRHADLDGRHRGGGAGARGRAVRAGQPRRSGRRRHGGAGRAGQGAGAGRRGAGRAGQGRGRGAPRARARSTWP